MAVNFAGNSSFRQTGTIFPSATVWTIAFWVKFNSLPASADYYNLINIAGSGEFYLECPGNDKIIQANGLEGGGAVVTGQWYRVAVVRNGSSNALYVSSAQTGTLTAVASGAMSGMPTAPNVLNVGSSGATGASVERLDGRMINLKIWSVALTAAQITTELGSFTVANTTGLLRAHRWDTTASATPDSGSAGAFTSPNGAPVFISDTPTPLASSGASGALSATGLKPTAALTGTVSTPPAPGDVFDLERWKLTLPVEDPNDPGDALEVTQPELDTYSSEYFSLSSGRIRFVAPIQGGTTPGSQATRSECREMQDGVEASWTPFDAGLRQLTVTERVDPTSITDRQEIIIGQIHAGANPAVYLAAEWESSGNPVTPRIRVFKDRADGSGSSGGVANMLSGSLTTTTDFTWRISVQNQQVIVSAALGGPENLPTSGTTNRLVFDATTDFDDDQGWYFKFGAYNKSEVATGGTGQAVAEVSYFELIQPGGSSTTGSITATGLKPTAAVAGAVRDTGALSTAALLPTATSSAAVGTTGSLTTSALLPTSSSSAAVRTQGSLVGAAPAPTTSVAGTVTAAGSLASGPATPIAALASTMTTPGSVAAALPVPAGSATGTATATGALAGASPMVLGQVSSDAPSASGSLVGTAPAPSATAAGTATTTGALATSLSMPSALFTVSGQTSGSLTTSLPLPTTTATATAHVTGSLGAALPTPATAVTASVRAAALFAAVLGRPSASLAGGTQGVNTGALSVSLVAVAIALSATVRAVATLALASPIPRAALGTEDEPDQGTYVAAGVPVQLTFALAATPVPGGGLRAGQPVPQRAF